MAAVDIKSADTQLPARRILSTVWNLPEAKMRFIIALLLVHLHGQTEAAQCACATEGLNVRSAAGTSHGIVHVMQIGECATYLGQSSQADGYTWLHLSVAGQTGWAASNWLHVGDCGTSSVQLSGCPHIVTRAEWGARAPKNHIGNMAALPIYVFVHHGDGGECFDRASCIAKVKAYQNYHMDTHGWPDIGYNFVVGEDGNAYEARGWSEIGAHTLGYNNNGIAICVIGNFNNHVPNDAALATVKQLIQCGLANGKINPNYTLKGHRDVGSTDCPGTALYNLIHTWPHYASGTALYG
ncbi:peptidoglycan-recognition protein SC2-like [Pomacea canaliculata]|uniref:peptidoglycan-recognition protein SC2-like n=1 Tax=Pomacea canaliculata TaxID=400727 RepID=UPI000D73131A|nr:peptidoglycan-recognition protein SC2-like [Pomacea canaliculata]